jgi:hypothetical protein
MRRHRGPRRLFNPRLLILPVIAATAMAVAAFAPTVAHRPAPTVSQASALVQPNKVGMLDCSGLSPIQRPAKMGMMCIDARGSKADGGRFEDNGHYIGHDEPSIRFISSAKGSGRNFTVNETLPQDPAALPTVKTPGKDVTHMFELTIAPWFSTTVCDPNSAPLTPCTPGSDANAPKGPDPGAGAAFVELQFYPPGDAPFQDDISCDATHWCSALNIDSLECEGNGSTLCNNNCVEPVNFAFVQTNGVPTGPPSPQLSNNATFTPNKKTLLMNPGDKITVRMFDAAINGGHALEVLETDHTTGQSGFMIASGANGFMNTNPFDCTGTKFNFQPEYNTAKAANIIPWGIGPYMINDTYEIGHFEPCTKVTKSATISVGAVKDTYFKDCSGPYESGTEDSDLEPDDAPCYKFGDTHKGLAAPPGDLVTGCGVFFDAIGDLDFDGTSYRTDWPTSTVVSKANKFPTPFLQSQPTTFGGRHYASIQFMTDISASELNTHCNLSTGSGCVMPPKGPGHFYPYFTQAKVGGSCVWEYGNMTNGDTFGGNQQYGKVGPGTIGAFVGKIMSNPNC